MVPLSMKMPTSPTSEHLGSENVRIPLYFQSISQDAHHLVEVSTFQGAQLA